MVANQKRKGKEIKQDLTKRWQSGKKGLQEPKIIKGKKLRQPYTWQNVYVTYDEPEAPKFIEVLSIEPDKLAPEVQDPLKIINLGTEEDPMLILLSGLLGPNGRAKIVNLLHEIKEFCMTLHRNVRIRSSLVEHMMPIKKGYKLVKQAPRRMSKDIKEKSQGRN